MYFPFQIRSAYQSYLGKKNTAVEKLLSTTENEKKCRLELLIDLDIRSSPGINKCSQTTHTTEFPPRQVLTDNFNTEQHISSGAKRIIFKIPLAPSF